MKWREVRNPNIWNTGPEESNTYWTAKKNGVTYTVCACWKKPLARSGDVVWCASVEPKDGPASSSWWKNKDAAIRTCEKLAGVLHEMKG